MVLAVTEMNKTQAEPGYWIDFAVRWLEIAHVLNCADTPENFAESLMFERGEACSMCMGRSQVDGGTKS